MNIFVTDESPVQSALWLDDVRLVKMILESAQLLCSSLWWYSYRGVWLYRPTHMSHPCAIWTRKTRGNYEWLVDHALAMCAIYSTYSGKTHACERIIQNCNKFKDIIPRGKLTEFANATPYKLPLGEDDRSLCQRYRDYMCSKWNDDVIKLKWSKRPVPYWYQPQVKGIAA